LLVCSQQHPPSFFTQGGQSKSKLHQLQTIEAVQASNFPQIPYKNFSTLFCKKVRLWNLEQTLAGK
jgi:hypothetical protein